MSMNGKSFIGVDIGGTKTAVVLSGALPQVMWRQEFPTLPADGPQAAIQQILALIEKALTANNLTSSDIESIGVSCGGPLDPAAGVIQAPPNLSTWVDVPIARILSGRFGVVAHLENDANAGAVAEHRFGAGVGTSSMVFLTMGTGLGAGIVLHGRLYRGASECAGEIGHVRLTKRGPVGYGKAGSVEGWASGAGMAQTAVAAVESARRRGIETTLDAMLQDQGRLTAQDVAAAASNGDAVARRVIRQTGKRLGQGLAILVDVLNPERIVVGGLAMRLGEAILAPARAVLRDEALEPSMRVCEVVPAALGETIGDLAALCVATGL